MKVHVDGSLYIESDEYQFILREYTGAISKPTKEGEEGRPVYRTLGYYTSVEGALNKVLTMKIKQSTASNLRELIYDVGEIRKEIRSKINF